MMFSMWLHRTALHIIIYTRARGSVLTLTLRFRQNKGSLKTYWVSIAVQSCE
jgi:hypothetical protein